MQQHNALEANLGPIESQARKGFRCPRSRISFGPQTLAVCCLWSLALELLFVQQSFMWGFLALVAGVAIALFPSNYEIVGMSDEDEEMD